MFQSECGGSGVALESHRSGLNPEILGKRKIEHVQNYDTLG